MAPITTSGRRRRWSAAAATALFVLSASCSDDHGAMHEHGGALSGHVRLVGPETSDIGAVLGTQAIGDLEGAIVRLENDGGAVAATSTSGGGYAFEGIAPGEYRVRLVLTAEASFLSDVVSVADHESVTADTIVVSPPPGLVTYPNPFPQGHGAGMEFTVPDTDSTSTLPTLVRAFRADGHEVWRQAFDAPPGFQHIHWHGMEVVGSTLVTLPPGVYWVSVEWPGSVMASFVVNEG